MNEIQKLQYKMLVKLDEVCRKNNLVYYLAYGTCIGAVRHKGFIPWDHDVDVLMPIDHVRKLEKLQNEFGREYFVSTYRTDKDNRTVKAMVCDRKNKCRVLKNGKVVETINVCMDIYPFYKCPSTKFGLLLNIWKSHFYKILVGGTPQNHGMVVKMLGNIINTLLSPYRDTLIERIEKDLNYTGECVEIADYYGRDITFMNAITYDIEWFSEPKEIEFEGRKFFGPTNPDKYLTKRYGDYMTPVSQETIDDESKLELITEEYK